jgi:hypothetical protein
VEIARDGLERIGIKNERGESEAIYLDAIARLAHDGHCPADVLRSELKNATDFAERVVELTAV